MILLDTSILVYAVGEDHPLREPSRRIIDAHGRGAVEAATTLGVIAEFAHVRARRRTRTDAAAVARDYLRALEVVETTAEDVEHALDLLARHGGLGAFDALVAAVAIRHDVDALVSGDHGFADIAGLRWVDPASANLDVLLSGRL